MKKVIILVLISLLVVGCGVPQFDIEKDIVGEWQDCSKDPNFHKKFDALSVVTEEHIIFDEEGSFIVTEGDSLLRRGRYKAYPMVGPVVKTTKREK